MTASIVYRAHFLLGLDCFVLIGLKYRIRYQKSQTDTEFNRRDASLLVGEYCNRLHVLLFNLS